MENSIKDSLNSLPEGITTSFSMDEPNQSITIFEGLFNLKNEKVNLELKGKIWFSWFPNSSVNYIGIVQNSNKELISYMSKADSFDLMIDGLLLGKSILTNKIFNNNIELGGEILGACVLGDRTISVSKIRFSIPNLKYFYGTPVKMTNEKGGFYLGRDRLIFENEEYIITIDKKRKFDESLEKLKTKGGFLILYYGELTYKKGAINYDNLNNIIHCFSTFLSFLNGRKVSPLFLQGIFEEDIIWTDYSSSWNEQYKPVFSWTPKLSIEGFNSLWQEFSNLWKYENDRHFLNSVIHWYTEANSNAGFLEGSVIMIQTALELIYNWLIIEKKKLLIGKDGENISAANKIRLLISQIHINSEHTDSYKNLLNYINAEKDIDDEIDAFVQFRNAIIHSQEEKRKRISKIPDKVKYELQQLGIWYIESALLFILKYEGKYRKRCSGKLWSGEGEIYATSK